MRLKPQLVAVNAMKRRKVYFMGKVKFSGVKVSLKRTFLTRFLGLRPAFLQIVERKKI
jgi:hypothetical protein